MAEDFDLTRNLIAARRKAQLTQGEVAERMQTSQSYVARLESGAITPSLRALQKYAKATGTRLKVELA